MILALRVDCSNRDFSLDLDGETERERSHTHRGTRMTTHLRTEGIEDEVREPVDNRWLFTEPGDRVDHAEYAQPTGDTVERPEFPLEGAEHR